MRISKEFKIGLFSIITIALLYLGFNFLKGIDFFSTTNSYFALYKNIDGLQVSNSVIINGLAVGRVSSISFLQDKENNILVELDIDGSIILDDSTQAFLISEGFLGGKAIELRLPDKISNPLQDGDTLKSEVAMGLFESFTEQTLPVANDAGALIRKSNSVLDSLILTEQKIREMISKINRTLDVTYRTVEGNRITITNSLNNIESLTGQLNKSAESLTGVLDKTDIFVDSLNHLDLSKTLDFIASTSENLNAVLAGLKQGEGSLGKFLVDDSLYNNLTRSADDLDKLLIDLRENPKRYVHISVFGKKDKSDKKKNK